MKEDRCSHDVWYEGRALMVIADMDPEKLDSLCMLMQNESDILWDWGFMGGRAVLKYIGDDLKALRCLCRNIGLVNINTKNWRFYFEDTCSPREDIHRLRTGYYDGVHDFGLRRDA